MHRGFLSTAAAISYLSIAAVTAASEGSKADTSETIPVYAGVSLGTGNASILYATTPDSALATSPPVPFKLHIAGTHHPSISSFQLPVPWVHNFKRHPLPIKSVATDDEAKDTVSCSYRVMHLFSALVTVFEGYANYFKSLDVKHIEQKNGLILFIQTMQDYAAGAYKDNLALVGLSTPPRTQERGVDTGTRTFKTQLSICTTYANIAEPIDKIYTAFLKSVLSYSPLAFAPAEAYTFASVWEGISTHYGADAAAFHDIVFALVAMAARVKNHLAACQMFIKAGGRVPDNLDCFADVWDLNSPINSGHAQTDYAAIFLYFINTYLLPAQSDSADTASELPTAVAESLYARSIVPMWKNIVKVIYDTLLVRYGKDFYRPESSIAVAVPACVPQSVWKLCARHTMNGLSVNYIVQHPDALMYALMEKLCHDRNFKARTSALLALDIGDECVHAASASLRDNAKKPILPAKWSVLTVAESLGTVPASAEMMAREKTVNSLHDVYCQAKTLLQKLEDAQGGSYGIHRIMSVLHTASDTAVGLQDFIEAVKPVLREALQEYLKDPEAAASTVDAGSAQSSSSTEQDADSLAAQFVKIIDQVMPSPRTFAPAPTGCDTAAPYHTALKNVKEKTANTYSINFNHIQSIVEVWYKDTDINGPISKKVADLTASYNNKDNFKEILEKACAAVSEKKEEVISAIEESNDALNDKLSAQIKLSSRKTQGNFLSSLETSVAEQIALYNKREPLLLKYYICNDLLSQLEKSKSSSPAPAPAAPAAAPWKSVEELEAHISQLGLELCQLYRSPDAHEHTPLSTSFMTIDKLLGPSASPSASQSAGSAAETSKAETPMFLFKSPSLGKTLPISHAAIEAAWAPHITKLTDIINAAVTSFSTTEYNIAVGLGSNLVRFPWLQNKVALCLKNATFFEHSLVMALVSLPDPAASGACLFAEAKIHNISLFENLLMNLSKTNYVSCKANGSAIMEILKKTGTPE